MSRSFELGCATIDLNENPWNVKDVIRVYVYYDGTSLSLYDSDDCLDLLDPPTLRVPGSESTGLYFYMSSKSAPGASFCDGRNELPLPISWQRGSCPSTITYGKIKTDRSAFSIQDYWSHHGQKSYEFDLNVHLPDGSCGGVGKVEGVDPAIMEVGEDPPPEESGLDR